MELCCRCAEKREYYADDEIERPLTSLYVTSEAHPKWMKHNALSFRWPQVRENVGEDSQSIVRIVTAEDIKKTPLGNQPAYSRPGTFSVFIKTLKELLLGEADREAPIAAVGHDRHFDTTTLPDIVVIDSLNTLPGDKLDRYKHFMSFASAGPKLIIAIADSDPRGIAEDWEFAADIVVRLDEHFLTGYLLRTIEVVKARYQSHVWGTHQLKIYGAFAPPPHTTDDASLLRAHPYREQGGIFIFPSIHFVLSRYKTKGPSKSEEDVPSRVPYMNALLGNGFPRGRCIALIGGRGTHKSHLGYLQALAGCGKTNVSQSII